ncbi:uncharacterized protein LOC111323754 [Stylophora pistillata]|uniref:uncharacterized protein LOC111323754 n=1 Tax=Stylophora pistillata TaxID=50429 RepID=UPI000C04403D|nr:uncharacterized protein LOC111323754 [Stylophora pistillata]
MKIIDSLVFAFLPILVVGDLDFLCVSLEKDNSLACPGTTTEGSTRGDRPDVFVSWLNRPPYIYNNKETNDSLKDDGSQGSEKMEKRSAPETKLKGIVYEVVNKALKICLGVDCHVNYSTNTTEDLQQLNQVIAQKTADIALPVQSNVENKYGGHEYVQVMKSPGFVFIVNKQQMQDQSRDLVVRAMKDTWPVVVITLLMTCSAGLLIWALDTVGNPDHFPRAFTHGIMEGIWWSFVSMTTVGYGDRTPKSYLARFFGILWILIGLVLCSFFTATFTSALTSSSIKQRESFLGVKVAVIADSNAYDEALKHAANVKEYTDFYQMYKALMEKREVQGILADIYTASYFMHNINDTLLAVKKFFASQHSIGFVIRREHHTLNEYLICLRNLFKYRQRDVKKIILRHIQVFHNETLNRRVTADDIDVMVKLLDGDSLWFRRTFHILLIVFFLMLTVGLLYEFCRMATRPRSTEN